MSRIMNEMNATATPYKEPAPESGFRDNFEAGVGQMIDEELSISRLIHTYTPTRERNDKIRAAREIGDISDEVWHKYADDRTFEASPVDWEGLAIHEGFDTIDDIQKRVEKETLEPRRRYRQDVFSTADTYGKVGQFAGMASAGALDPIMAPTYLLGPVGVSRSLSVLNAAGRVAAREAVIGGASQAAVEPFIHSWKEDIGASYTVKDSIANISMTAGASAAIGGVVGAIGQAVTVRGLKDKIVELRQREYPPHVPEPEKQQMDAQLRQQEEELIEDPHRFAEEYMADVEGEVGYQTSTHAMNEPPIGNLEGVFKEYPDLDGNIKSLHTAKAERDAAVDKYTTWMECFK